MTAHQNQMVSATALCRGRAIDFPAVFSGLVRQGFVTPDWRGLRVRACLAPGCARRAMTHSVLDEERNPSWARRTGTSAREVPKAEPMTAAPSHRRGGRLIPTGQQDHQFSRGRRRFDVSLGGLAPVPICGPSALARSPAQSFQNSPISLDLESGPAKKRPLSLSKHARTHFLPRTS